MRNLLYLPCKHVLVCIECRSKYKNKYCQLCLKYLKQVIYINLDN